MEGEGMERLTRAALEKRVKGKVQDYPCKVVQFGEGNFLRGFVDWMIDRMNERGLFCGKVVVVQPIKSGLVDELNKQDGLYTLILRGLHKGAVESNTVIITCVSHGINPYENYDKYLELARNPDLKVIVSNCKRELYANHIILVHQVWAVLFSGKVVRYCLISVV
ncbi:MAG: hypothetical protein GX166_00730 [Clostridiaceae bacterium]|jgi:mannitol-1-phosphate/altronate dehydrogenase|nr:hypothetical protein [Clostridiaceae bacterium]